VGLQLSASLIERASRAGLALGLQRLGADLVAIPRGLDIELERAYITGEAGLFYMAAEVQNQVQAFDFVAQTSPQLYLKSLTGASCCSAWNIFLIGFDPQTDFTVRPWLAERPDISIGPDEVVLGAALAAPAGTGLKFYGHHFKVAGSLAPSGLGLDRSVFIPLETAYRMAEESSVKAEAPLTVTRDQISALMIKLRPAEAGRPRALARQEASKSGKEAILKFFGLEQGDVEAAGAEARERTSLRLRRLIGEIVPQIGHERRELPPAQFMQSVRDHRSAPVLPEPFRISMRSLIMSDIRCLPARSRSGTDCCGVRRGTAGNRANLGS
jgi:hypothetical protein